MRQIPEDLRARLASGATTLCHCWRVMRRDNLVRGFTDHDRGLVLDSVSYSPASGFSADAVDVGPDVDSASVVGVLSDDAVSEADLAAGLWDGARVDMWRVDWTAPELRVHLFAGRIGAVRRGADGLVADLVGLQAGMDAPFGRVFSRFCDAEVGDGRCGVDLSLGAFRGAGTVSAVTGPQSFTATGFGAFADGWFTRGVLTAGAVTREVTAHRVAGGAVSFEIDGPAPAVGVAIAASAGCDKRFATCRAKFANAENFRGFPHMPGDDALLAGVDPAQPMDGGSRVGGSRVRT